MNAIFALGIEDRLLDVAVAVGLLLLAGMILVHLVWQPTKRLWIIQWSLAGGLVLALGLVCPWHRFSLGVIRSGDIATAASAISTNLLSDGSSAIDTHADTTVSETTARQKSERTDAAAIDDIHRAGIIGQKSNSEVRSSKSAADIPALATTWPLYWIVRGYLLGALGMLCWLAVGQWKVRRLIGRASPPGTELAQLWQELQSEPQAFNAPAQRTARLLVSDDLSFPVAIGVVRPAVLLPRWLVESHGPTPLRTVLVHELAHVNHNDAVLRWLAAVFQIAFYYQPLFWFLRRQLQLCQEFLADAQAAGSASSASDYAEQLVLLLKAAPVGFHRPLSAIGIIEGRSELYRRIQMLVACPRRLEINGNGRWNAIVSAALLVFAGSLGLVTLRAADPKQPDAAKTAEAQAPAKPEFKVHVVDSQGKPVAGAKVTPTNYSYRNVRTYGGNIDADDAAPAVTDADGLARIVFEMDEKHLEKKPLKDLLKFGFNELELRVEHPEHPTKIAYFDPIGTGVVTLVDPETVEIRAHRVGEKEPLHRVYPVLKAPTVDWSEAADGVITIQRVDVRSEIPSRFLRIVHIPDDGRAWFSDVHDLLLQKRPIAIDAELKPGVRVEGRLADNVPRPIKHGRVVARIVEAQTGWVNGSYWDAAADIAADGTFVFESLPPNSNLQVTAICDGWVSQNPTDNEIQEHWQQVYGHTLDPIRLRIGLVFPQVFRFEGDSIKITIPMSRTATYEITVLDENDRPIPGARVGHWPNVLFYGSGNYVFRKGIDRLTRIQTQLKAGIHQEPDVDKQIADQLGEFKAKYERTTDAHGIAVISNLPCGDDDGAAGGQDVTFYVGRDGYLVTANPPAADYPAEDQPSKVHLNPGQTSHVTVHMHKAPEKAN